MRKRYYKIALAAAAVAFLASPVRWSERAVRGPASLQVPENSAILMGDPAFAASYNSFYSHFLGASQEWISGLEQARGLYGMKSPLFSDPSPIAIQPFKLWEPGWFQTGVWSGMLQKSPSVSAKPVRRSSTIPVIPVEITTASAPAAFSAR